jgi:hypothetical protein
MYDIFTAVQHNEFCTEPVQCNYSSETECKDNKCRCKGKLVYEKGRCIGKTGMYALHVSYIQTRLLQ